MNAEALRVELQTVADELIFELKTRLVVHPVGEVLSGIERTRLSSQQTGILSKIVAPDRKREWSEARRCEWELDAFPLKTLSHTKREDSHFVFAWGAPALIRGIGIDAEPRSREISEASSARFVDVSERTAEGTRELSPLQLWTIKEAVFKANSENSKTLIPQYRVSSYDAGRRRGTCLDPEGKTYRFATLDLDYWIISLARAL